MSDWLNAVIVCLRINKSFSTNMEERVKISCTVYCSYPAVDSSKDCSKAMVLMVFYIYTVFGVTGSGAFSNVFCLA